MLICGENTMFIGQYKYNIDDKGRIVIPQEYRKQLGESVIVNKGFEKCVTIYPIEVWNDVLEKSYSLSMNQSENRAYVRYLMGSAFEKGFDSQGRVQIDDVLRKYANITKECVIVGANKVIEIWSMEAWNKVEEDRDAMFSEISEKIVF